VKHVHCPWQSLDLPGGGAKKIAEARLGDSIVILCDTM
jgi:hypothetical protein